MSFYAGPHFSLALIALYALSFAALNTVSFLIALFYKKKFKQSSPRWGFIIAVTCSFMFIACLLSGRAGSAAFQEVVQGVARGAVAASVIASVFSTVSLISIMQQVRK